MTGKTFEELRDYILLWARDNNLIEEDAEEQFMKLVKNIFEFNNEWLLYVNEYNQLSYGQAEQDLMVNKYRNNMKLKLGEMLASLIILCEKLSSDRTDEIDLIECLEMAYDSKVYEDKEYLEYL